MSNTMIAILIILIVVLGSNWLLNYGEKKKWW